MEELNSNLIDHTNFEPAQKGLKNVQFQGAQKRKIPKTGPSREIFENAKFRKKINCWSESQNLISPSRHVSTAKSC